MSDDKKPLFEIGAEELDKRIAQANKRARQEGTNREALLFLIAAALLGVYSAWRLWTWWVGNP